MKVNNEEKKLLLSFVKYAKRGFLEKNDYYLEIDGQFYTYGLKQGSNEFIKITSFEFCSSMEDEYLQFLDMEEIQKQKLISYLEQQQLKELIQSNTTTTTTIPIKITKSKSL